MNKRQVVMLGLAGMVMMALFGFTAVGFVKSQLPAIKLDAAVSVDAVITTKNGNLIISGGASDLLVANLASGETEWQPQLTYRVTDTSSDQPFFRSRTSEAPEVAASP